MLEAMVYELTSFELRRTEAANLSFGAFKTGKHDDLVIAVGLAVLRRREIG